MIILDTNVVSELISPALSPAVAAWFAREDVGDMFVSAVTEAELRYGGELLPLGRRRDGLFSAIDDILSNDLGGRIVPFNSAAARAYASIVASRRAAGRPIGILDAQIAATARSLGASVATRDLGGFEGTGVEVINPWTD